MIGEEKRGNLELALAQWSDRLGPDYVKRGKTDIGVVAATTLPSAPSPLAILQPANVGEVADVVRIAAQHGIPLYPVSTGRNWGYGDACPVTDGQVLLDLRRMNRIVEVNEEFAYAVVEPGVTQGQLADHLRGLGGKLRVDCTGAGPETSIIGNIMERGFGHSAYGNRAQTVCGMQVVLGDGSVIETGFGHYANARAARLYPNGIGPALDGLFMQSNLGIVTQLGLWLMPVPDKVELFVCIIEDHAAVRPIVDGLRRMRLDGTIRSVVHLANDFRLISSSADFPWSELDGRSALPDEMRGRFRKKAGIGAWALSGSLMGDRRRVAASRASLRRSLSGRGAKLLFLSEGQLRLGEFLLRRLPLGNWAEGLRQRVESARGAYELNTGVPTRKFLRGAYWRHRAGSPMSSQADPARDRCGLIWLSPVVPMSGEEVERFCALVEPVFAQWGFEFLITLSTITDRALGAVMTVAYDKESDEETSRAERCYHALFRLCMDNGYIPYRLGIQSMAEIDRGSKGFWDVAGRIKMALDPDGVIAPGRYQVFPGR